MFRPILHFFRLGGKKRSQKKIANFSKRARLAVESLEDRSVPSAAPFTGTAHSQSFNSLSEAVFPASTTTNVGGTTPSLYGNSVTLSAVVAPAPGAGNGTVSFFDNGAPIPGGGAAALNDSGVTSIQVSALAAGSHDITAVYSGGEGFAASTSSAAATQKVSPAFVLATGITASDKTYDGDSIAALDVSSARLTGVLGSDQVTLNFNAADGAFNNKNVGQGKPVTVSGLALAGADAGNYALIVPTTVADIAPIALTVTGISASDKAYDGNVVASLDISSAKLSGLVGADAITLNTDGADGVFNDKNVGSSKSVTVSGLTLAGTGAGNYALAPTTISADITPQILTVTANDQDKKHGNALTLAGTEFTSTGLQNGETIGSVVLTMPFGGPAASAPAGKYSIVPSAAAGGTFSANNYSITYVSGTLTVSSPESATTAAMGPPISSIYGRQVTLSATVTPNPGGGNGTVSFFDDGKPIPTGTMVALNGNGVASFQISSLSAGSHGISAVYSGGAGFGPSQVSAETAQVVSQAVLMATGITASDKTYDGDIIASLDVSFAALASVVGSDSVALDTTNALGIFNNRNTGINKPVNVSGLIIKGVAANNYTLVAPTLSADIDALPLTLSGITASDKVYDGDTTASLDVSFAKLSAVLNDDDVHVSAESAAGNFNNKNVAAAKPVTISGLALTGADAKNYVLAPTSTTADITPLELTVSGVSALNKTYDGTTSASLNFSSAALIGVVDSDTVNLNVVGATGKFADRFAGDNKTVAVSGLTIDNSNYSLTQPTTAANITPATSAVSLVASLFATTGDSLVVFVATVSPSADAGGAVTFKDNGVPLTGGTNIPLSGGVASFSTTLLTIGNHPITADFSGGGNYAPSTSNTRTITVTGATTSTTLADSGPNPLTMAQSIGFTVKVASVKSSNGETVELRDANHGNAMVASGTLSGGAASITLPAGALTVGTHNLVAIYNGNSFNSGSLSSPDIVQVVAPAPQVLSVTPNANIPTLTGAQRSRVGSLVVVFNQAVQLDANAMALTLHTNNVTFNGTAQPAGVGVLPTELKVNSADNITWVITFSGNTEPALAAADGVDSLADGIYDLNINAAGVHPIGAAGINLTASSTTVFHRLYGDSNAPDSVAAAGITSFAATIASSDNLAFATAFNNPGGYSAALDFDGDGRISSGDNFQFRNRFNKRLTWTI